ncbi:hypothetical protein KJ682_18735 [bacterium]|nr:hypothetical protein [bacterium]
MMIWLVAACIMLVGFLLRNVPFRIAGTDLGVDHWYWKLYLETYWRDRRFPPELPQYLLEEHQWYPPLFIMLVARLPRIVFERYSYLIGLVVDLFRLGIAMTVAAVVGKGDPFFVAMAGIVYATTPVNVSYNVQLNPRGLGGLFLDLQILLVLVLVGPAGGPWWLWGVVWSLGALVLLTHKMTTQLLFFLSFTAALITGDVRIAIIIPASMLVALMLSGGFYWNVLRAHWDIVLFWFRNWPWLQVHPLRESPIYGEQDYLTPTRFYQPGLKGMLRHARYFFVYNPWAWFLVGLVLLEKDCVDVFSFGVFLWLSGILLFGVLTLVLPWLRCLGAGYFYVYNTALPAALLWGALMASPHLSRIAVSLACAAFTISLSGIVMFYRHVRSSRILKVDDDFENLICWLTQAPCGTVMCLPANWYDVVAYRTGHPVLYGAHGYGFKSIEPIFPRLLLSLDEVGHRYGLRYLVTMEGYLNERFMTDLRYDAVRKFGPYRVYLMASCG